MKFFSKVHSKYKMFLLFFFALFTTPAHAQSYAIEPLREHFKDVLLVIHYNHPFYYASVEFEKELYSPIFKNIVFYGDRGEHPEVTIVHSREGYFYTNVVKDVLIRHPGYAGYIFMQDDCIMQFWHYLDLNKDKIWFGKNKAGPHDIPVNRTTDTHLDGWFNTTVGIPEIRKVFPLMNGEDRKMLASNYGENGAGFYFCDFFYLPGRFSRQTINLCDLFANVFCEISIPTVLACLDRLENWEPLYHFWICFNDGQYVIENYKPEYYWLHGIKFSIEKNRDFVRSTFKEQFYDKLEK